LLPTPIEFALDRLCAFAAGTLHLPDLIVGERTRICLVCVFETQGDQTLWPVVFSTRLGGSK
jgi:hypothetical protein